MPPKAKSKDKGKAPQTQPTKPESPKPYAKLMSSAILAVKPIKSWYEESLKKKTLQNHRKYKQTHFNIGLTLYPNHHN
jgi:hypothetical protein